MFTQATIEDALNRGMIETEMCNGKWWKLRRNGATKVWKSRPGHFRVPVKAGLRSCAYITHENMNSGHYRVREQQD